jgi:hypothetical protein
MVAFRKLLAAALLSLLFLTPVRGQANLRPGPILAHRSVEEHLWWYLNGELLLDHVDLVRNLETKVAIRVCTKLPKEKAIRESRGAPLSIANHLKSFHSYTPERVLILFYRACPAGDDKKIFIVKAPPSARDKKLDVEVWVVPKGAALPPAEEVYKADELELHFYNEQKVRNKSKRNTN